MKKRITMREALEAPTLLQGALPGKSWSRMEDVTDCCDG